MTARLAGSILHIDLDITSAILNHCGIKGFLAYASFVTYKKHTKIHYVAPGDLGKFSLLVSEKDYTAPLIKLQEMGLIVKKGKCYTSTNKNKRWLNFVFTNYDKSLTLGGTLCLKLDEFYHLKKCKLKNVEERLFLTISNAVRKGKSLSRGFIKDVTGVTPKQQLKIERKYHNVHQDSLYMPINGVEQDKITHIPHMKGHIQYNSSKVIDKSENKKNHCMVIRLGNTMSIDPSLCHGFLKWKKSRKKRESLALNEPVQKRGEICDWDSFYATIDLSTDDNDRTKRYYDLLNIKDKRYKTWKWLKKNPYHAVNIINKKGDIVNLRDHLRRFSF